MTCRIPKDQLRSFLSTIQHKCTEYWPLCLLHRTSNKNHILNKVLIFHKFPIHRPEKLISQLIWIFEPMRWLGPWKLLLMDIAISVVYRICFSCSKYSLWNFSLRCPSWELSIPTIARGGPALFAEPKLLGSEKIWSLKSINPLTVTSLRYRQRHDANTLWTSFFIATRSTERE